MSWTKFAHWRLQSEGHTIRIIDDKLIIETKDGRQVYDKPDDTHKIINSTGSIDEVMELL